MQSQVEIVERDIAEDRSANYRGTARVRFEALEFDWEREFDCEESREIVQKNVQRLIGVFDKAGYDQLDSRHHIPAIISQQSLDLVLQYTGISLERLLEHRRKLPPKLKFPPTCRLKCLHSQYCVEAAKQWGKLPPKDKGLCYRN